MAALGSYDFRDPSLEDYINFEHALDVVQRKGGTKQEFKIIQMECTMPAGATMIAADSGRTNVLDGVATPIIVYAISSDNVEDKAGQDGALEVTVLGTDGNNNYIEDVITLNGTTQVAGVVEFQRVIAAKLTETGVDGVGTGNVTISNTGQTATYLTIPAGQTGSAQAGKMWIPEGWKFMMLDFAASLVQTPDAAAVLITEGANVWPHLIGVDVIPTEDEIHQYSFTNIDRPPIKPHWGVHDGADDLLFDIFHQSIDTDNIANIMHYDIFYLVWKEA